MDLLPVSRPAFEDALIGVAMVAALATLVIGAIVAMIVR